MYHTHPRDSSPGPRPSSGEVMVACAAVAAFWVLLIWAALSSGCAAPSKTVITAARPPSESALDAAHSNQLGVVAAGVAGARKALSVAPASVPVTVADAELQVVATALPVPPAKESQVTITRVELALAGNDVSKDLAAATVRNSTIAETIHNLESKVIQERATAQAEQKRMIEEIKNAQDAKNRRDWLLACGLVGTCVLLILAGAVTAFFLIQLHQSPAAALGLVAVGLLSGASVSVVGEWWFRYALGGIALVGLGVGVWMALKCFGGVKAMKEDSAGVTATLGKVVKSVDELSSQSTTAIAPLVHKLSVAMDQDEKAVIKAVRARLAVAEANAA